MGEIQALFGLTFVGVAIAGVLVLFHVRVAPRRRRGSATSSTRDVARTLARVQIYAALFVCFGGLVLLLAAWAARVEALGRAGLGVAALVTAPLLVGFAHLIARGGLEDDDA